MNNLQSRGLFSTFKEWMYILKHAIRLFSFLNYDIRSFCLLLYTITLTTSHWRFHHLNMKAFSLAFNSALSSGYLNLERDYLVHTKQVYVAHLTQVVAQNKNLVMLKVHVFPLINPQPSGGCGIVRSSSYGTGRMKCLMILWYSTLFFSWHVILHILSPK